MNSIRSKKDRQSIRYSGYDYSQEGGYFVTICTQARVSRFGKIANEEMKLNEAGKMIEAWWSKLPTKFPEITLDYHVVMPNHFHGILMLYKTDADPLSKSKEKSDGPSYTTSAGRPHGAAPTLSAVINWFKTMTTNAYIRGVKKGWPRFHERIWQRNYYEHIIRNDWSLAKIREYIVNNPLRWELDRENPDQKGADEFDGWLNAPHEKTIDRLTR